MFNPFFIVLVSFSCIDVLASSLDGRARVVERAVGGGTPADFARAAAAPLWPYQQFATEPDFHPPVLEVSRQPSATDGLFVFAPLPFIPNYPDRFFGGLIMDPMGNPIYHTQNEYMGQFQVQRLNGKPVLTYWTGAIGGSFIDAHGIGAITILDNTYRPVRNVTLNDGTFKAGDNLNNMPYPSYIDIHESLITERNSMIVTAYNSTPLDLSTVGGPRDGWVLDSLIYEFDLNTNETLFRWSSVDHLSELPLNGSHQLNPDGSIIHGTNATHPWDYFLTNSVSPLPDQPGYIVSSRHYWSAITLDAKGNVTWIVDGQTGGDFTFTNQTGNPSTFSWQHYVRPYAGVSNTYLQIDMFNNNNNGFDNGSAPSTALRLHLDFPTKTVRTISALQDPNEIIYADSQGTYDRLLGQHKFVAYGQIPVLKEYDQADRVIMSARFGVDNQISSYRSFLVPDWSATPYWEPKVVITRAQDGSALLSMSWNGATPDVYDGWAIYESGGRTDQAMRRVPRTGFESNVTLTPGTRSVAVEAMKGTRLVRSSANVTVPVD